MEDGVSSVRLYEAPYLYGHEGRSKGAVQQLLEPSYPSQPQPYLGKLSTYAQPWYPTGLRPDFVSRAIR